MEVWSFWICFLQQDHFSGRFSVEVTVIYLPLDHFVNENGKRSKVYEDVVMLTPAVLIVGNCLFLHFIGCSLCLCSFLLVHT